MLYPDFTEKLLGLRGLKVTNMEESDEEFVLLFGGYPLSVLFRHFLIGSYPNVAYFLL